MTCWQLPIGVCPFRCSLALCQDLYKRGEQYLGGTDLQKRCITQAKQAPERSWLADVSNVPLAQSVRDLDQAFRAWWACLKGKRRGKGPCASVQDKAWGAEHSLHPQRLPG